MGCVADYFDRAALHAEAMLRNDNDDPRWLAHLKEASRRSPRTPAQALATRALTRAMVVRCAICEAHVEGRLPAPHRTCGSAFEVPRLRRGGSGARAREVIDAIGWGDASQYRNDVPGRLSSMAEAARERGW